MTLSKGSQGHDLGWYVINSNEKLFGLHRIC